MRELRSHLARYQPERIDAEAKKRLAGAGTASWSSPSRIRVSAGPSASSDRSASSCAVNYRREADERTD
jgi:hypothetical protein